MELVRTGTVVGGRYRALRVAWPSAVGPVWQAKDSVLDRDVLLFTLAPDVAGNENAVQALLNAAAHAAALVDANIAQVYDCSAEPPYLVSEMPPGRLAERIADKPMPLPEAARIVVGVASALRAIHEHGSAHGAVGPAWVGIDEEGRAKLLGSGMADVTAVVSAIRDAPADPPLQPGGYPEAGADARDHDVRALAALALHMITGKPPSESASLVKTGVPQALATVIERGLRGDATLRQIANAFETHAAPPAVTEKEPGFLKTEGRWLAGVLLAVAIAVGVAIGSVALVRSNASRSGSPKESPAPSTAAIEVAAVHDFDPFGSDKIEHPDQAARAADGNATTAWFTVGYATARFGEAKSGVGLVFDLRASQRVGSVKVRSPFEGWQGEIRVADADAASPDGFRVVGTFTAAAESTVTLTQPAEGRYWLLWITRLTDAGAGGQFPFQAAVAEVQFVRA